ncbi:reverse transcriptase-like protein [Brevibacillus sp. AG]|uniref:ribonuclease HI family protein n=1 Tax=Brevibacillus sp. AG TaxID=3020891 RepID=UPI00232E0167|nr:reverse transcriptase-like protein [Brevibacillus sp. AG]MDC0764161.1 reverse transcriptase-like protein [Brevibacillus sp. AG]
MYTAYCDGYTLRSSGYSCIAYVIKNKDEDTIKYSSKIGKASIHEAEYSAIIFTLKHLVKMGIKEAIVFADDALVINQINGTWEVSDKKLLHLHEEVSYLRAFLTTIQFQWIPEANNEAAVISKGLLNPKPKTFSGHIEQLDDYQYKVSGKTDYIVDLFLSTCTCPAFKHRSTLPCKHIISVRNEVIIE